MKGISHQRQRSHPYPNAQFNDEECDINHQHHNDSRRLCPRHPGRWRAAAPAPARVFILFRLRFAKERLKL